MFTDSYQEAKSSVEAALRKILSQAELLLPNMEDVQAEMMGDLVDEEMQHTAKAIEEAAAKIAVLFVVTRFQFNKILQCIMAEVFEVILQCNVMQHEDLTCIVYDVHMQTDTV